MRFLWWIKCKSCKRIEWEYGSKRSPIKRIFLDWRIYEYHCERCSMGHNMR